MLDCTSVKREWKKKLSRGQEHKNQQHTEIDANDETKKKKSGRFVSLDTQKDTKKYMRIFLHFMRGRKNFIGLRTSFSQVSIDFRNYCYPKKKWYTLESQIEDIKTVFHSLTRIFNDF